jgi:phosphatidyl-myo-inositol dimannoside synthase
MRVLLITDTLRPDFGWGRYSIGLIRALREEGASFSLLSPRELCTEPDLAALPDHGPVTSFVSQTRRLSKLTLFNALRIARKLAGCDAVHCLTEPYAIPASLVAGRKPLLVTLHGTYAVRPFTRRGERWWYELAYRRADRLCPVSHFTRSLLPARFQMAKTQVVPEGVEIERFGQGGGGLRTGDPPFLLSVGPIKKRKGYAIAIEAFARVRAARPDVEYWIVGGTDDRVFLRELQERIAALGLQGAVKLLGRVTDGELVSLYQRCVAYWLLAIDDDLQFEGFGLTYWEALAAGAPAIGTRRSGAEDAIVDGESGYLVDPHDAEGAARAALALLSVPDRARAMGAEGRRRVHSWGSAAREFIRHYEALT